MFTEMLTLAGSVFLVRMFSQKRHARVVALVMATAAAVLGLAAAAEPVLFLLTRPSYGTINLMGVQVEYQLDKWNSFLATTLPLLSLLMPLAGYGLAAGIERFKRRYEIRIIADV